MADPARNPSDARDLLEQDLNGLLSPADAAAFSRSVADPALVRERAAWDDVRAALRPDEADFHVRPGLAAEISAAVRRAPAPIVVGPWRRAASVAAAVLVGIGLFGLGRISASESGDVVAHPREIEREEALRREALSGFGCDPATIERDLAIGRDHERMRAKVRESVSPSIAAIDREEILAKWNNLPAEARQRWLKQDPGLVPPDGSRTGK